MKGRIIALLLSLPLLGIGVWMGWSIGNIFNDAWQMRSWQPAPATLTSAGYTTSNGESDTWEAYAEYTYQFNGQTYVGNRVTIDAGSDNIGSYQRDTGNRLSGAMSRGESITVWVHPADPSDSIIDRDIRWAIVGFKSIFVLLFGGFGVAFLVGAMLGPRKKDETLPQYKEAPWTLKDEWQTESVRSDSKSSMWAAWMFAAIWNLISAFMPFISALMRVCTSGSSSCSSMRIRRSGSTGVTPSQYSRSLNRRCICSIHPSWVPCSFITLNSASI